MSVGIGRLVFWFLSLVVAQSTNDVNGWSKGGRHRFADFGPSGAALLTYRDSYLISYQANCHVLIVFESASDQHDHICL